MRLRHRLVGRLTSFSAAIALVYALAVPPVAACEGTHAAATNGAATMADHGSSMPGDATESDCPESDAAPQPSQGHDSDCLAACLYMVGCAAPCFVAETALLDVVEITSQPPATTIPMPSGRYTSPDRPPPRLWFS
jgi:hypothetical protein